MERLFVLSGARENIPSDLLLKEVSGITPDPDRRPTSETRQEDIEKALTSTDWNISKAARQLGINRRTIYRKIKKYGIQRPNSQ
jgi:transcriptional regulator of acetoin/glycerol metabolism